MSNGSLRSLRCSPGKPPSSSDPTKRLCRRITPLLEAFRRLLLQIGGANIASADRVGEPPTSLSLGDERHVPSLLLSTTARDPVQVLDGNRWHSIRWFEAEDPAQEVDLRLGLRLDRLRSAKAMALTLEHDQGNG